MADFVVFANYSTKWQWIWLLLLHRERGLLIMLTLENTKTIYDLVQNAGKEYGDKNFLRYDKNDVLYEKSYRELAEDSNAISAWVEEKSRAQGYKAHAAFLGRASYEYLVALLGTAASGAVSIPLDVQLSKEAFVDCLSRADVDILFYDWEFRSQVEVIREECMYIKEFVCIQKVKEELCVSSICKEYAGIEFVSDVKPEDCAFIIFTSGTTGKGKGVMLSHGNLIDNTFCTTEKKSQLEEVCLNVLPIHHVFCLNGDVFIIIRYGSSLCLCPDLSKMLHYIQVFQPTIIRLVPMMAKMLINKIAITQKQNPELSMQEVKEQVLGKRLHRIVSGGGYLAEDLALKFAKFNISIAQGYGMSECSPKVAAPDYDRMDKLASVGKLVDRCQVRIVFGEIQVKSPSVMMGYYKDSELTEQAITKDGWLRTGDLGYVDEENFLYLTGRKKNLIILSNGENVSPEGIENKFDGDILISDILVYGAGETIAAEVYPNYEYAQANQMKNIEEEVQKIVNRHNEELPSYARIASCHVRKHPFEKTSSKKIIRQKYFDSKKEEKEKQRDVRLPENDLQQKLYDILSGVIGNELFGIDSNFYQSGLDSFGSILFIEELHNQMEQNVTLNDLMEHNTILLLEEYLNEKKNEPEVDLSLRELYPLTNMQKYFAYIIKGNTTGNLPFTFKLGENVDLERLKRAIEETIDAHPGLKAIFKLGEQGYQMYRDDTRKIDIPIISLTEKEWEERLPKLLVPFAYTPDDNLFHIYLFQTESAKYLFFDVAHSMGDGITMNILLEDVNKCYQGEKIEKETYTFYEYALEEQHREKIGIRQKNLEYIDRLMKGLRLKRSILNKKGKDDYAEGKNAVIRKRFDSLVRKKILYFCKKHGVSENVLFLTAFNYCISLFSDEKNLFSNSIHSGRTDSRWTRLAGSLFLAYYCRFTQVPHERVPELLKRTGKQIMNTMKCFVSVPREGEMFFQFQGDIMNINQIGGEDAERIRLQLDSLPFHMQVMSDDTGYYMELRYWENRFDSKLLEIFLTCFENVALAMLEERSVRRLKKHLPEEVYPKHFFIEAGKVNQEIGYDLVKANTDEKVKVYILDEGYRKKPFGAWGPLFVMDCEPDSYSETIQNPYGPGILYNTQQIARILPDGSVDFLENSGRTVLTEGIRGRRYYNLAVLEKAILEYDGISEAEAYLCYNPSINEMSLEAKIQKEKEVDEEQLKAYLKERCGEQLVPATIREI